ncbi:MAG: MotA/TolQ/ExbB proton channel family protein [Candidatus Xiphinematobacter sp.]|nr:MAG: MotA/TolQ/ExbB proton channel family protein [Candidatus Xiphinematobacter sp.]QQY09938.1 MAG: MotA/TolQ/ExbB proton channel family protein [Candidatus Xiphinematobacter sp.]QQY11415.1 MAG: MotA/TolQ/ExbB proton channel family protein [Candidatus Xiphinematobacter sp.]
MRGVELVCLDYAYQFTKMSVILSELFLSCARAPGLKIAAGLIYVLGETSLVGYIVLLTLFLTSILSWSVTLYKLTGLRTAKERNARFVTTFRQGQSPLRIYEERIPFGGSPLFEVYKAGCEELRFQLLSTTTMDEGMHSRVINTKQISPRQIRPIVAAMEQAIVESTLRLESLMIVLSTAVSGAPFLGLLGTVWGVMDVFAGIAVAGNVNLTAMAPGVAGALTTTVAGLLVAIPAMFAYNFLTANIRSMITQCESFAAEFSSAVEHRYVACSNLQ